MDVEQRVMKVCELHFVFMVFGYSAAMYMSPGTACVFMMYGMHHCLNISSMEDGGAVLVRACEPVEG